jgi:hypothetical protein
LRLAWPSTIVTSMSATATGRPLSAEPPDASLLAALLVLLEPPRLVVELLLQP